MDQISRIEYIHSRNSIHRIIKRANQVNVVDFGLAKKYRVPKTSISPRQMAAPRVEGQRVPRQ
jgi:hypothetical protein